MMSDKELLELAANARGGIKFFNEAFRSSETGYREWNPLSSDGDAFRLAVQLNMEISITDGHAWAMAIDGTGGGCSEFIKGDPFAAARRAITRAAAMGRSI